ncbi:metallophosphoesterase 1-like isoform X2 [Physella acuta]|nr:metallophosphoesterase 1-like isoform X2 [Physella acuta]XP_059160801.1 metallophosphoesterase 1-like isoform X2 [Physella acuta]XP_059160802.1 metallophosphoesterase 1-like isoform X2 [Physella acuta]
MIYLEHVLGPVKKCSHLIVNNKIFRSFLIFLCFFLYCEVFHYAVVMIQCTWPSVPYIQSSDAGYGTNIKVMFIADTHLLGFRQGHWFDKLRREWQMKQAFQTTMLIHKPDVVFVLGDLLDEGKWCDDEEFLYHVARFKSMFAVPKGTQLHVLSGNHDEGFHYMMTEHKHERFVEEFNSPSVRILNIKNNLFVLVNSMAMEGDECSICLQAEKQLQEIAKNLSVLPDCLTTTDNRCKTQPILLQHFPMYRASDSECNTEDSAPPQEKTIPFRPRLDCLDLRSTHLLFSLIQPRLVISAHTHHGCYRVHDNKVPEWSVSSFSWRNRDNPTLLLARINHQNFSLAQCFLPRENTVINIYILAVVVIVVNLLWPSISYKYRQKMC